MRNGYSITAWFTTNWWCDQMFNNVVAIDMPGELLQAQRLPDGSYHRPRERALTVEKNGGEFTVTTPQQDVYSYNTDGNLETIEFPAGVTITLSYTNGMLTSVSNGMGRSLTFNYSGDKLALLEDSASRTIEFSFTSNQLTTIANTLGHEVTFSYDEPGRMVSYFLPENPTDPMITNEYDSLDRVESQLDMFDKQYSFYFAGWRSEMENPVSASRVRQYDSHADTTKTIDELGFETTYERDGLGRILKKTWPEGNSVSWTYYENNNVLTRTREAKPGSPLSDIVETFTYDPDWNKLATASDGEGNTTTLTYDQSTGTLLTIEREEIDSQTPTVTFTYNGRGQVLTRTDETGIVDKFEYDTSTEKLLTWTHDFGTGRLNLETSFGYDTVGCITSVTDPRGNTTSFEYDDERRMTERTEASPFDFITNWVYNDNGWLTSVQRETGDAQNPFQTWNVAYDLSGKVIAITNPSNNTREFEYDDAQRLLRRTDAEGRVWEFAYDAANRVLTVTDPMEVVAETRTYTDNGRLETIKDANDNVTNYEHDGFDRLSKRIYADTTFEQYSYNANDQIVALITRKGDTISLTYDVLNRLETRDPGSLPVQTMSYDLAGRLTKISTPVDSGNPTTGDYQFFYDTAGRLLQQRTPDSKNVTYQLDENGNVARLTYPDSYYVDYVFDELNRLTDIKLNGSTTSSVHFELDALSRRTSISYENGTTCDLNYEINDDLSSLEHTFVGSSVSFSYDFNNVQELIGQTVSNSQYAWLPEVNATVSYSEANELNQYPEVDGATFEYNLNGSLTDDETLSGVYDELNRLTQVVTASVTNDYWYDPLNRQGQKSVDGVKTGFLYDRDQLIAEYDGSSNLLNRYVRSNRLDEIFVKIAGGTKTYLHHDRLGSVIAQTNSSGAVTEIYTYSPFGETPALNSMVFGFTGQRYDAEIDLYHYKSRYYKPDIGRFLQPDRLGYLASDLNLYSYVNNSPTNFVDPLGLVAGFFQPPTQPPSRGIVDPPGGDDGKTTCIFPPPPPSPSPPGIIDPPPGPPNNGGKIPMPGGTVHMSNSGGGESGTEPPPPPPPPPPSGPFSPIEPGIPGPKPQGPYSPIDPQNPGGPSGPPRGPGGIRLDVPCLEDWVDKGPPVDDPGGEGQHFWDNWKGLNP